MSTVVLAVAGTFHAPDIGRAWPKTLLTMIFASLGPVIGSQLIYHITRSSDVPRIVRSDIDRLIEAGTGFALYLRDFEPERAVLSIAASSHHGFCDGDALQRTPRFVELPENRLEDSIYLSLKQWLHFVALSNHRSNTNVSIPMICVEDGEWTEEFQRLAEAALLVVVVASRVGPGLEFEFNWLKANRPGLPLWLVATPPALQHIRSSHSALLEAELTWTSPLDEDPVAIRLQRVSLPDPLRAYLKEVMETNLIARSQGGNS